MPMDELINLWKLPLLAIVCPQMLMESSPIDQYLTIQFIVHTHIILLIFGLTFIETDI
jgi:hypothetical protein